MSNPIRFNHTSQKQKVCFYGSQDSKKMDFLSEYKSKGDLNSIGLDHYSIPLDIDGRMVKIQCWDTPSTQRFKSILSSYLRDSLLCFLFWDYSEEVSQYLRLINNIQQAKAKGQPVIVLRTYRGKTNIKKQQQIAEVKKDWQDFQQIGVDQGDNPQLIISIVQGTYLFILEFIRKYYISKCGSEIYWVDALTQTINKIQSRDRITDKDKIFQAFGERLSKKKNIEETQIIRLLLNVISLRNIYDKRQQNRIKILSKQTWKLEDMLQQYKNRQDPKQIQSRYRSMIQKQEQQLLTFEYWAVQIDNLHRSLIFEGKLNAHHKKVNEFHEFVTSIDPQVVEEEQKGTSLISPSQLLGDHDYGLRWKKRANFAEIIQKYKQITTDLLLDNAIE